MHQLTQKYVQMLSLPTHFPTYPGIDEFRLKMTNERTSEDENFGQFPNTDTKLKSKKLIAAAREGNAESVQLLQY